MGLHAILAPLVARCGGRRVVASALGVRTSAVGNWLSGHREPRLATLIALLDLAKATDAERASILHREPPQTDTTRTEDVFIRAAPRGRRLATRRAAAGAA